MWESIAHFGFSIFLNILNSENNVKDYGFAEDIACFLFKTLNSRNKGYLL